MNIETKNKEKDNLKKIEAILFISGRFLNMQDLISLSGLNPLVLRNLLKQLEQKYEKVNSAIQIVEKNNMWKMDVRPEFSYIINRLATGSPEFSKAEQETLAIIALKQPVKQSVIVKIRGNKAYDHIKKFSELEMIKKKKAGRTYELRLNTDFYDYFNISEGGALNKNA